MPKFQENKGFKMPGIGSKEKHTPGSFREEHHVDKMGYCDDTPLNMLPPGSSPVTFMGNEPLASSSDGSPLSYQWSLDDDPYTSVKYTPGSLDFSDAFGDDDTPPVESESNPGGKQGGIEDQPRDKITYTFEGSDQGNTGVSYEEGYKKADKKKYPTLESFTNAAKDYWKKKNSQSRTVSGIDLKDETDG